MKKKIYQMLFLFMSVTMLGFYPLINVYAEASSGGAAGTGDGASGGGSSSSKLPGDPVAGVRMTIVDRYGKMVSGTHTVDFVNKSKINDVKSSSMYKNTSANRHKGGVIDGNLSWGTSDSISVVASPVNISFSTADRVKLNGKTIINYLGKLAKTDELYNNWITKTGYSRANINYNQHYIIVEPTLEVVASGKHYYGTATELAKLIQSSKCSGSGQGTCRYILSNVAREYLGPSACYDGEFAHAGKKNNGVTLTKENTFVGYISSNKYTSGPRFEYKCSQSFGTDSNLYSKSGGKYNGNAVDVFYMAGMIKEQCDINNPNHFHSTDGSDDQDYKPVTNDDGTGTAVCCEQMIAQYGQAYVEKRYPICGACPVKTTSRKNACGSEESVTLTDEHDFSCLFRGVSGKDANKYSYSSRKSVRKKYKVGTIGSKYCEVYCIDDIIGKFPGNYQGQVTPGGSLIWPSYNNDYKATLETTRTCKIRFRQQEWLNAFNKGNADKKQLVNALKECAGKTAIMSYYDKYIKTLNPTMTFSYNNGVKNVGPKTLKLDKKKSTYSKTCSGCNVSTSGLSVSNVVSRLNSIANGITNKVLTIKTNLRYVLPDGLYQYVDKKTGTPLESYTPTKKVNKNGTVNNTKITDTGSSKLVVDENAKVNEQYKLLINYNNLSPVSGKFKSESGEYTCTYTPTASECPPGTPNCPPLTCDYNEPNHFKDINNDGILDSGPNGEDCCEYFANKFGTNSDEYKKLVEEGLCPDPGPGPDPDGPCDPNDPNCPNGNSCVYPNDLATPDIVVKNKCCAMILVDTRYSLKERNEYYKQYCTGDPYCPQDCDNGKCTVSPMTQALRNCISSGKSYNECKIDNCPGSGKILIYRPISLYSTNGTSEAFPGAEWPKGNSRIWSNNNWYYYSNWAYRGDRTGKNRDYYVNMYITNNRGVKEYDLYSKLKPMYTVKMNSKTIRSIRSYNTNNSYDDFKLKCNDKGRQCRSNFIKQYATGCGVGGWYDCQGISKERGD